MKKKLITDDMRKLVQSTINNGATVDKYELNDYDRFKIGSVDIIYRKGSKPEMHVHDHFSNEYSKLWRSDVGKYLMSELRKDDPQLYETGNTNFKALLKLVKDNELEDIEQNFLKTVKVGTKRYLIIKAVSNNSTYNKSTGDYDLDQDEDELYSNHIEIDSVEQNQDQEEDDIPVNSYALF